MIGLQVGFLFGRDHSLGGAPAQSLICLNRAENAISVADSYVTMLSPADARLLLSPNIQLSGAMIMTITARCINAGPLNKPIRTHSAASALLSRLRRRAAALLG